MVVLYILVVLLIISNIVLQYDVSKMSDKIDELEKRIG